LAGRAGTDRRTERQVGLAVNQKPIALGLAGVPLSSGNLVSRATFVRFVQCPCESDGPDKGSHSLAKPHLGFGPLDKQMSRRAS
jgi:hypothetical protein